MLKYGRQYVDVGAEYYEGQYRHIALRNAKRRAAQLGYKLVPTADDPGILPTVSLVNLQDQ